VIILKKSIAVKIICLFTIGALLFAGCSSSGKSINNPSQDSTVQATVNTSTIKSNVKDITDSDLLKSADEDSTTQLDSADDNSKELTSDEIDTLLNDNSDIDNIPSNYKVK